MSAQRQHETIDLELAELKRQELVELSAAAMPVVAENGHWATLSQGPERIAHLAVAQAEAVVREIDRSMADAQPLEEGEMLARLRDENERMRATLRRIADRLRCRCEPCWTDRGRHAPECLWDVAEEALEAAATPAAERAAAAERARGE